MKFFVIQAVLFYQKALSPYWGGRCRFIPTCSDYMKTSIEHLGVWKGLYSGILRIARCHPWGGSGLDPAPHEIK